MDKFNAHILVVDDDDGIRSLVKKYLEENRYLVTTANCAEDADEKIKIIEFDLIILDIMMPGKSGLEFIKENKKYLETPIILLTAKGEPTERIEGLEIGADDYLPKPFEPKELILRIKNIICDIKHSWGMLLLVYLKNTLRVHQMRSNQRRRKNSLGFPLRPIIYISFHMHQLINPCLLDVGNIPRLYQLLRAIYF